MPDVVPQVGLRKLGREWSHILERDLSSETIREWLDEEPCEIKILGQPHDVERLSERLIALGMPFTPTQHLRGQPITEGPSFAIEHEFLVATPHRRAAAKNVFNYTAKVLGCATFRVRCCSQVRAIW